MGQRGCVWIQGEDETSSTDLGAETVVVTFSDEADAAMSDGEFYQEYHRQMNAIRNGIVPR